MEFPPFADPELPEYALAAEDSSRGMTAAKEADTARKKRAMEYNMAGTNR